MADVILMLENDSTSINLNDLLEGTDEGMQALAGLTGFGLPPVDVQWTEGAGDGARGRGVRVLSRTIDLPLYLAATERAGLKAQMDKLSLVLAGRCTLRLIEPDGTQWTVSAWRTGGGDYVYGEDTNGNVDLLLVVTITTESPYWSRTVDATTPVVVQVAGVYETMPIDVEVTNPGTVKRYINVTLTGPGQNYAITDPTGRTLTWNGVLYNDETLTINGDEGTVTDGAGLNRYAELAAAPQFPIAPPGISIMQVSMEEADAVVVTNRITNPRFESGTTGWTLQADVTYDAGNKRINATDTDAKASITATGLTVGATYYLRTDYYAMQADANRNPRLGVQGGPSIGLPYGGDESNLLTATLTFTATATSHVVELTGPQKVAIILVDHGGFAKFDNVALTNQPSAYFDGATTDTADITYAWTGSADNSTSTATFTTDPTESEVSISFSPGKWMVV